MVDIGCNIGLYALALARTGAKVVAIDANPDMVERARFNAQASGLELDLVYSAVGDRQGSVHLERQRDDAAIVRTIESDDGDVPMKPLMQILQECGVGKVDALKIDIEGFEDKALAPWLVSAPEEHLPSHIVIEMNAVNQHPACRAAFDTLGYREVGNSKINTLFERES